MTPHAEPRRRPWPGFLALALPPALLLLDTAFAMAGGWRPGRNVERAVVAFAALWLASALACLATARGRSLLARRWAHLSLLLMLLLATAPLAEGLVALYLRGFTDPPFHRRWPYSRHVSRPLPGVFPGISGPSRVTANSLGIRGPELPPREAGYRLLCLGGSTTECHYLDDEETWPHLLEGIVRACRRRGVRPIFVTHPVLWDERLSERARALLWLGWMEDGRYLAVERLREGMDVYNAALRETCLALDVPCLDLAPMSGEEGFFVDDCHFSEAGAREVARRMATWLREQPEGLVRALNAR